MAANVAITCKSVYHARTSQGPRLTGISFIVTVFDKRLYLPAVIESLARQEGPFEREFVFVDDGSSDGSADLIAELTRGWRDKVLILHQPNRGASSATNEGAWRASYPWLKFLDGDDLLVPGATARLLEAASATRQSFAYGDLGTYRLDAPDPLGDGDPLQAPIILEPDGLARFIRNCPSNSSTMLVTSERYWQAGGCDERLISPDQALFLRLFAVGGGARVMGPVALAPQSAPGRLSEQRRRSRYESVLALYYLVTERKEIAARHRDLAYRRALARARTYHRAFGGPLLSRHLLRYLASLAHVPAEPGPDMYEALAAFTENGSSERPPSWKPAALRQREAGEAGEPVRSYGEA
jgi:Glycosyl transferase family 2